MPPVTRRQTRKLTNEQLLTQIYNDYHKHPDVLGSVNKLLKLAHQHDDTIPVEIVRNFLHRQTAYTRHKPAIRHAVRRNRMLARGIGTDYQSDLADVQKLARHNRGTRFLLCTVDMLTKMAQVEPLKAKTGLEVRDAFQRMLKKDPLLADSKMSSDAGREFLNSHVQEWFRKNQIHHFTLHGEHKAAMIERFQRTLKERLHRVMTKRKNYKYIDMLQPVVSNYNHSKHSTLGGLRPVDVNRQNEKEVHQRQFKVKDKQRVDPRKFPDNISEGDTVLISIGKNIYEKGYTGYWNQEPFIVDTIKQGVPNKIYLLRDAHRQPVHGGFYREQLLKIK